LKHLYPVVKFKSKGNIVIKLVQAYDLVNALPGSQLYGKIMLSSAKDNVKISDLAVVEENDCIWPGNNSGRLDISPDNYIHFEGNDY
jgi:hypothetical protein